MTQTAGESGSANFGGHSCMRQRTLPSPAVGALANARVADGFEASPERQSYAVDEAKLATLLDALKKMRKARVSREEAVYPRRCCRKADGRDQQEKKSRQEGQREPGDADGHKCEAKRKE